MHIDTVFLPTDLQHKHLSERNVVVFDVLRATTTMTAALMAGVKEIRIFGDIPSAAEAGNRFPGDRILCGEERCLTPAGFDLGNSPGAFNRSQHAGRTAFMSTSNGTRAIVAALGASAIFAGALVNAAAVAKALVDGGADVTLLCAGTGGSFALEDLLGAGAVLNALQGIRTDIVPGGDTSLTARRCFDACRNDLHTALSKATGGQNVIGAGLAEDITFAARLSVFDVVGVIDQPQSGQTPIVRPFASVVEKAR